MSIEIIFWFLISLIIASIMGSMVGIGGGIVISPFLSYLNYSPSQISSTSLMGVPINKYIFIYFILQKKINFK